jgi:hypothetical protein
MAMTKPASKPIIWRPTAKQSTFLACPDHEVLYGGAAGAGKSDALLIDGLGLQQNAPLVPGYRAILLRKSFPQLRELVDRSREIYPKVVPGAVYVESAREWRFPSGAKFLFGYLDGDQDVYQYQGQEFQWVGFDELTHWASPAPYDYMISRLRSTLPGIRCYVRATTNPGGAGHEWVKQRWAIPDEGGSTVQRLQLGDKTWVRRFVSARLKDNPHLATSGYAEQLMLLPERERKALLDGRWDINDELPRLIDRQSVLRAAQCAADPGSAPRLLGVDPARFGEDRTAICFRQGRRVHWVRTRQGQDTMQTVGDVLRHMRELAIDKVFVDVCGLGAGVYDRLVELGFGDEVIGVNSAERAIDAERYHNKRTEMWAKLRDWLVEGGVQLPADDALQADLTAPLYSHDSNGRLKLEKKEDMKQRGLRSTDMGDALALTFAFPVGRALGAAQLGETVFAPLDAGLGY